MQFFVYDPNFKAGAGGAPPAPEMMEEMNRFMADAFGAGVIVATGALFDQGTRIKLQDGAFKVSEVKSIELKELMSGWAILNVNSLEEAIDWSKRFRKIIGDGESEIVQFFGPDEMMPPA